MDVQAITTALPTSALSTPSAGARPLSLAESSTPQSVQNPSDKRVVDQIHLQSAVNATNEFVKPINSSIEFSMDRDAGEMVVKVMDTTTKEVIRQIPSEEMLAIAKALDKIQGLLIKQKA
jgi:flagellar protein FlaG